MAAVDGNRRMHALVDQAFCWVAVRVLLWQLLDLDDRVLLHEPLHCRRLVVRRVIDEEDDFLQPAAFCVCDEAREVLAELDVAPALEAVPDYVPARPEERDEAVDALRVPERPDEFVFSFREP